MVSHLLLRRKSAPANLHTNFVLTSFDYMHAYISPTEQIEACSEGSNEGDCKLHITLTKNCV